MTQHAHSYNAAAANAIICAAFGEDVIKKRHTTPVLEAGEQVRHGVRGRKETQEKNWRLQVGLCNCKYYEL